MKIATFFLLIASLFLIAAQAPDGVAVIGDSLSHEYRCVPRGTSTAYNWVEILRAKRGVNFGTGANCPSYVYAQSGAIITQQMAGQVTSALNSYNAGNTSRVIVWLGGNDLNGGGNPTTLIGAYTVQLDRLLTLYEPQDILLIGVPQNDCSSNNANVNSFNTQLQSLAANRGVVYASPSEYCALLATYQINSSTYNYGGIHIDRWGYCAIYCLRLAKPNGQPDGHPGTVAQALAANALVSDFLGVEPVTESEVLAMMGLGSSPTNTPAPAASATATPSHTPTPHILDCGAGKHWVTLEPFDPQRVGCVQN